MATHSSILAWKISWTEEPGGLQSMGCRELNTTICMHSIRTGVDGTLGQLSPWDTVRLSL